MHILKRILVWIFVFITVSALSLYIFIQVQGKSIIEDNLTRILKRDVLVDDVRFIFPLGLRIDNLNVVGVVQAKEARVQIGFPIILGRDFVVSHLFLNEPALVFHRTEDSVIELGEIIQEAVAKEEEKSENKEKAGTAKKDDGRPLGLIVDHMEVKSGQVDFSDRSLGKNIDLSFVDINLKSHGFSYPLKSVKTKYYLSALIINESAPFSGSRIETDGWVNFLKKDMDGKIKIVEPNGMVGMAADLVSENNDLTVKGKIDLKNLAIGAEEETKEKEKSFSFDNFVMDALKSTAIEIKVDFAIKTKLDDFQLSSIAFSGKVGHEGAGESKGLIAEDLKNFGQQFYKKNIKRPVKEN